MKNTRLVLVSVLVLVLFVLFTKIFKIFSKQENYTDGNLFSVKNTKLSEQLGERINNSREQSQNNDNNYKDSSGDEPPEGDDGGDYTNTLDDLFKNLDSLEDKCGAYETKQKTKDDDEKEQHKKMIQEILDIENSKINELTEIVNFYRQKYFEKINIKNQCAKQTGDMLEKNIDTVIKNKNMFKVYDDKQINIDLSSQIENSENIENSEPSEYN